MTAAKLAAAPVEGLALLRQEFPPNQVSQLPRVTCGACRDNKQTKVCQQHTKSKCTVCGNFITSAHMHLNYVGHAALTDRLLDADPSWTWEPVGFDDAGLPAMDRNGGLWIRLTVCGQTRLGYGHPDGKTGGDAIKEAIGDALRNAAMRFGAALDLWHKGDLHADVDDTPDVPQPPANEGTVHRSSDPGTKALLNEIAAAGRSISLEPADVASDFTAWSNGTVITAADPALLTTYLQDLRARGAA